MSNESNTKKLYLVINKFLSTVPVNEIGLKDCLSDISWNDQAFLLNETVNNKIVKRYPIKISYQKTFLKTIIDILEKTVVDIHDDLYFTYCNLLSNEDNETYCYKHYNINKQIITLKENKNFISEGTTGLCTWQASLALSQWCINNKHNLKDKTILELGSGVGLVGLTAILHCEPKAFYLSDCHPKVLSILTENIELNIPVEEAEKTCQSGIENILENIGKTNDCAILCEKCKIPVSTCGTNTIKDKIESCGNKNNVGTNTITINFNENNNESRVNHTVGSTIKDSIESCASEDTFGSNTITDNIESCGNKQQTCGLNNIKGTSGTKFDILYSNPDENGSCGSNTTVGTLAYKFVSLNSNPEENVSCGSYTSKPPVHRIETDIKPPSILLSTVRDNTKVCVINLPWENVKENPENTLIQPDFILAADVVYDHSVFNSLCGAFQFFLRSNPKCEVILACTERNTETLEQFLQLLESNHFWVVNIYSPRPEFLFWSTAVPILFFRITAA